MIMRRQRRSALVDHAALMKAPSSRPAFLVRRTVQVLTAIEGAQSSPPSMKKLRRTVQASLLHSRNCSKRNLDVVRRTVHAGSKSRHQGDFTKNALSMKKLRRSVQGQTIADALLLVRRTVQGTFGILHL